MRIREKLYMVMGFLFIFVAILWGFNFYIVGTLEDKAPLINRASDLRWRAYALAGLSYEYNTAAPTERRPLMRQITEGILQYQNILAGLDLISRAPKLRQDWSAATREQLRQLGEEWQCYRICLSRVAEGGVDSIPMDAAMEKKGMSLASFVQTADRLVSLMEDDYFADIRFFKNLSFGLFCLALAAMVVIIYFVAAQIIRPLRALLSSFTEISSGATDLTQRIDGNRHDEIGQIVHCFNSFVTKVQDYETTIRFVSNHDTLTGLPNRHYFLELLKRMLQIAKSDGRSVAVLFLDLDEFKKVNDSLGHAAGDLLLQAAASRLIRCVRGDEIVARLGGDEFTVILQPRENKDNVDLVAQRILETFRRPFEIWEQQVFISVSIGISVFPQDGAEVSELLKKADDAMYLAKGQGKNNYFIYGENSGMEDGS